MLFECKFRIFFKTSLPALSYTERGNNNFCITKTRLKASESVTEVLNIWGRQFTEMIEERIPPAEEHQNHFIQILRRPILQWVTFFAITNFELLCLMMEKLRSCYQSLTT